MISISMLLLISWCHATTKAVQVSTQCCISHQSQSAGSPAKVCVSCDYPLLYGSLQKPLFSFRILCITEQYTEGPCHCSAFAAEPWELELLWHCFPLENSHHISDAHTRGQQRRRSKAEVSGAMLPQLQLCTFVLKRRRFMHRREHRNRACGATRSLTSSEFDLLRYCSLNQSLRWIQM